MTTRPLPRSESSWFSATMAGTASDLQENILIKHGHPSECELLEKKGMEEERGAMLDGLSFAEYMAAGSIAGMVEHMAMFPVDTLKTRMQMPTLPSQSPHLALSQVFRSIMRTEGPLGLYRGIGAMGLGAGPAHAVYFAVYEVCKSSFVGGREGHHPLAHGLAGVLATLASDAVFTPMDVVKQRLQIMESPYRGVAHCVRTMAREEGLGAFYASYSTTVIMNAPFTAVHFATYEAVKKALITSVALANDEEHLVTHLIAGGAAGAFASAVTNPLDVVKTRLQCQGVNGAERYNNTSINSTLKKIVAKEGVGALMKGIKPRVLFHTPAAAICWSTYESSKKFLQRLNNPK